ncbi:VOC family protein [Mycobacterium sp. ITM-2016-00318]|uniref:VOC family protein n=1 Tax=Mycobacterium sp. ITM-2016-00318 TaxID=2099693 RepID=UPI000CF88C27|nr:VOC family protein [Mycobacterium sp. ITM-2016-00318]WNG90733.1 VOC family protein [Mycobacterium sp. ITM-2016-00318]
MATRISHVGLCVSNIEKSLRFYVDGLGFEVQEQIPSKDEVAELAEVTPPVDMLAQFIVKDRTRLELLAWRRPGVRGEASRYRNQIGLTHLAFQVDDLDEATARLVSLGGTVIEETRTTLVDTIKLVVVKDPDGTRIELVQGMPT